MTIVLGTTLAAFAMNDPGSYSSWLNTIEGMREDGHDITPFAAIEVDARGLDPFRPLIRMIRALGGDYWSYMLDDRRTEVTTVNRLRHLTMGQNLVSEYATSVGASHLLFCAADCQPPRDLNLLFEMDRPYVGPEITTYCLVGEEAPEFPFRVHKQLLSVACVLIERSIFKRLRWRNDPDTGETDDPSYLRDVRELMGSDGYCRKDIFAKHYPECIDAIETRGHDRRVFRVDEED